MDGRKAIDRELAPDSSGAASLSLHASDIGFVSA